MKLWIVLGACLAGLPAHAVNKCTMADGRVVYSDTPCPTAAAQAQTVVTEPPRALPARPARQPAAPAPAVASVEPPAQVPPPRKIAFTGTTELDFIKASALMDNIQTIGRDCEWALKVDKSKIAACADFLGKLQPGGEFEQIGERVVEMLKDRPGLERSMDEARRLQRHMNSVIRYKNFMLANLGNASR